MNLDAIKIRPITNENDFIEAGKIIDTLIDADSIEDPIERKQALDILEAVTILACDYEEKHYPIPKPNPREAIKEAIEQLHSSEKYILARKNLPFLLDELHAEAKANGLTEGILAELLLDNE